MLYLQAQGLFDVKNELIEELYLGVEKSKQAMWWTIGFVVEMPPLRWVVSFVYSIIYIIYF